MNSLYTNYIKRFFDFIFSFTGIILSLPFIILVLPVFFFKKEQVFFVQTRPGFKGRLFRTYKLKTMADKYDTDGNLLPDKDRITKTGKLLRSLSLDEIPQLFNVLRGDMSLIGPRPLLTDYLPLYSKFQARRHDVRPGITGWAQVNGRNEISWQKRLELDVWYVDHVCLTLDMKILLMTVRKVIKREGINSQNSATMERFTGNN